MSMHDKHSRTGSRLLRRGALALSALLTLQACSTFEAVDQSIGSVKTEADAALDRVNDKRLSGAVQRYSGQKVAGAEVMIRQDKALPEIFNQPFSYLSVAIPMADILAEVGRRTGLTVDIQPADPEGGAGAGATAGNAVVSGPLASPLLSGLSAPPVAIAQGTAPITIDWSGSLKGFLDYLALRSNLSWSHESGRIYFFHTETRNFNIYLPGGKRSVSSSIALTGSGSGGGGGGGTVDVSSEMEIDVYQAIVQSVTAIVAADRGERAGKSAEGGGGGENASTDDVIANPTLGIITVTARPRTLDRVAQYLNSVNERFAQNVLIGVKVYNLTVRKDANVGASLSLAYESVARQVGVSLAGGPLLAPNSGSPGQLVVNALTGSRWSGSELLVQALEQIGDVSLVTSGQVITANGQPSPLQVANEISYLASSSTSQTANVGATTTLTPGTVTVGFTANFLPMIMGDNRILLQYQMTLSSLNQLSQVTSGDSTIQTPNIQKHDLQQHAFVKDGQSLVLFGFEQERNQRDSTKGMPSFGKSAGAERTLMVIVLEVHSGK